MTYHYAVVHVMQHVRISM